MLKAAIHKDTSLQHSLWDITLSLTSTEPADSSPGAISSPLSLSSGGTPNVAQQVEPVRQELGAEASSQMMTRQRRRVYERTKANHNHKGGDCSFEGLTVQQWRRLLHEKKD